MQEIYIDQDYEFTKNDGSTKTVDGIEYVKLMRLKNDFREPVLFTSFHSRKNIIESPQAKIITAIGHRFLRLPYSPKEYNEAKNYLDTPLTDIQLSDIKYNFCLPESAFREEFHEFKGKLRIIQESSVSVENKLNNVSLELDSFEKGLHKDYQGIPELMAEFDKLKSKFKNDDIGSVEDILAVTEDSFAVIIKRNIKTDSEDTEQVVKKEKKPWKILFLDDQLDGLKKVFKVLDKENIEYDKATNVLEAQTIINKDEANKVTVVVSDFRLYDENSQHQKLQGYDFLEWLAVQNRYNALVALSGLSTKFLFDSFRKKSINVKVYSKNAVIDGGAKFFVEELLQLGDLQYTALTNVPKSDGWKPIRKFYTYHRNNKDYYANEENINSNALKIIKIVEDYFYNNKLIDRNTIIDLVGNPTTDFDGKDINDKNYKSFLELLTRRRIFYYFQLKGFEPNAITVLLKTGNFEDYFIIEDLKKQIAYLKIDNSEYKDVEKKKNSLESKNYKSFKDTNAINSSEDLPSNILVEEKYFFTHYLGISLYDIENNLFEFQELINSLLNDLKVKTKDGKVILLPEILKNLDEELEGHPDLKKIIKEFLNSENKLNDYYKIDKLGNIKIRTVSIFEAQIVCKNIVTILKRFSKIDIKYNDLATKLIVKLINIFEEVEKLAISYDSNELKKSMIDFFMKDEDNEKFVTKIESFFKENGGKSNAKKIITENIFSKYIKELQNIKISYEKEKK